MATTATTATLSLLQPGDCLLYSGSSLFSYAIRARTFSRFTHTEIFVGNGRAIASRDGDGVGNYPLRTSGLAAILRPNEPVDINGILRWYAEARGKPYDVKQLFTFYRFGSRRSTRPSPKDRDAYFCSEAARDAYEYGGFYPFAKWIASKTVWPGAFYYSPHFNLIWEDA